MKSFLLCLSLIGLCSSVFASTQPGDDVSDLQDAAVAKFLKLANQPSSDLGKNIAAINVDTTDGRNHAGDISLPVKKEDLQVVAVNSEEINGIFHYGERTGDLCAASSNEASFLIFLSSHHYVHRATESAALAFVILAKAERSFKTKSVEPSCQMAENDEKNPPTDYTTVINLTEPKAVKIPDTEI